MASRDPLKAAQRGSSIEILEQTVPGGIRGSMRAIVFTEKTVPQTEFLVMALSKLPMLVGAEKGQVLRLVAAMETVRVAPREVITRVGHGNSYLYIVSAGRITLTGDNITQTLGPGDCFGQEALDYGGAAEATAVSTGSIELWRLHRRAYRLLQIDYGERLRRLIQSVIQDNRAKRPAATLGQVARMAMERKAELEDMHKSLVWQEFADVQSALSLISSIESVGKGAFGDVMLGVHGPTRKAYAVKYQKSSDDPKVERPAGFRRKLIDREIRCMRDGASPFLMRFYGEYDDDKGNSRMILEFLGGGSLESIMGGRGEGKGMGLASARFYFACVASGFDCLHTAQWMHRDMSAKNVMVDNTGYAKLIDCGLAKPVRDTEHTYTLCGTPVYYAPEMIKSIGYGHMAEWWACGVLLHEIFTGELPFFPPPNPNLTGNKRRLALYDLICKEQPVMNQSCFNGYDGNAARELISGLLKKKPVERFGVTDIRTSDFFKGFDWASFHSKRMPPPFVPKKRSDLPVPR